MSALADVHGMQFRFKTEDSVGRHIFKRGSHEPTITRWLMRHVHLGEDDIALDIGANIGWYSVLLQKCADPGAVVFAFEPDRLNFRLLRENLALNHAGQVEPIQIAVAEGPGRMRLHPYPAKNLGRHSLLPINPGDSLEVETISVDGFLADRKLPASRVKLIKIDVEGYEAFVLRGMTALLRHSPIIIAEYSPQTMRRNQIDPRLLLDLLTAHDFVAHTLDDGVLRARAAEELAQAKTTMDLLWLKKGPDVEGR